MCPDLFVRLGIFAILPDAEVDFSLDVFAHCE